MYKGKFNQKSKGGNVQEILAQREQTPHTPVSSQGSRQRAGAAPQRPQQPRQTMPQADLPQRPAAAQRPLPQKPAAQPKAPQKPAAQKAVPQKQGPRLGGVIFYTLYFMFILVFFIGTFAGLIWLRGWLVDYQASQPTVKSEQVFASLFTDPDWDALYQASGIKDSPFEGKDAFVSYMENKVGDQPLTFLETTAGLSGDKKYVVRLGDEKVASFTLVDKNKDKHSDNALEEITALPDWQLGAVDVFFERSGSFRIQKVADHTAYVNGVALDDSYTIQKATTRAEAYLPTGVTSAKMYTQEVTGLMSVPTVTIQDKNGQEQEVTYDADTQTFTQRTTTNTISDEEKALVQKAAETHALFMIEKASLGEIAKYFDNSANAYKQISKIGELWMQDSSGHEFANQKVSGYERYNDELFSAQMTMDLNVTRTDGTVKTYPYSYTLFFRKTDSGNWKVFEMSTEDVSAPMGQVRLTFLDGINTENLVHTAFFDTSKKEVITPLLPVPEGKVFAGWYKKEAGPNGTTQLSLVFQPDETGKAVIPENMNLEPMTLYALFEDASDAAAEGGE